MEAKRKKASLAVASVALVAVLAIAGTFAYLQDSTGDVTNTFKTNEVKVTLTETTGENYNIIPGTSQDKNPKVTVNNSVNSYVFVKVDDKTDGLVTYEIADGWTKLDGYDNVYYREVEKDAGTNTFSVLKNDKVFYPASLTNKDMLDEDGNLKDDIKLTFTAYAIQQEGFNSVEDAWLQIPVKVEVSSNDFAEAVETSKANEVITLTEDVSIDKAIPQSESGTTNIDLNGHALVSESTESTNVSEGKSLNIENGMVEFNGIVKANETAIAVGSGSSVTLNKVTMSAQGAVIFPRGDSAAVNVVDSTVKSETSYCVATNAATVDNYGVKINLQGSTLDGPTPVLVNIPCSLTMRDCTVFASMQGVVVRGGTAVIEGCKISNTSTDKWAVGYFDDKIWGSGNTLPLAGITIGNKSNAYQYPSNVTLKNTEVTSSLYPVVYIYGNATKENGVTLTYDNSIKDDDVTYGGGYVVVNGVVQKSN